MCQSFVRRSDPELFEDLRDFRIHVGVDGGVDGGVADCSGLAHVGAFLVCAFRRVVSDAPCIRIGLEFRSGLLDDASEIGINRIENETDDAAPIPALRLKPIKCVLHSGLCAGELAPDDDAGARDKGAKSVHGGVSVLCPLR